MTEHDITKALEIWTLQNLLNISIMLGILACGLALVQNYYRALEKHLSLRVSIELWRVTDGAAGGCPAGHRGPRRVRGAESGHHGRHQDRVSVLPDRDHLVRRGSVPAVVPRRSPVRLRPTTCEHCI